MYHIGTTETRHRDRCYSAFSTFLLQYRIYRSRARRNSVRRLRRVLRRVAGRRGTEGLQWLNASVSLSPFMHYRRGAVHRM